MVAVADDTAVDNYSSASKPTLIDLFCGAGGMSHGFIQAGFSVIAGIDFDEDSLKTFAMNHPGSKALLADLSTTTPQELAAQIGVGPGHVDCIVGGPPCQGFSRNRAFRHVDGAFVDDPRNHLYWHFFEYIAYFRPQVVVMENVPEILIKADGSFREAVFDKFNSLGYHVEARVVNAAEYGVPQLRRRAIFLAGLDYQKIDFPNATTEIAARPGNRTPTSAGYAKRRTTDNLMLPSFSQNPLGPTVWDAIGDLQGSYAPDLYAVCEYANDPSTSYQQERRGEAGMVSNHFPWQLTERQLRRIRLLTEGQGQLHLPEELQVKGGYGSAYRRLQSDAVALTLTTWLFHPGSGMFTHPFEDRALTIREAARIQSFQDDFAFLGKYHSQCRQVGNSVAPQVAKHVAKAVLSVLARDKAQGKSLISVNP